jgi:hypothetical protein
MDNAWCLVWCQLVHRWAWHWIIYAPHRDPNPWCARCQRWR